MDNAPPLPRRYQGVAGFNVSDDIATPNNPPLERSLLNNAELVTDLARFAETLCTESAIRRKWRLTEETWEQLGADDEFVRAVEEERTRRVRSGATKRELAQQHIVRGPNVLAGIMDDTRANAKHRVDAIKTLDAIADPGPEAAVGEERIYIRIDLSAAERAKGQEPNPGDVVIIDAGVQPKPKPIDSWEENTLPRKRDDDGGNNF